MIVPTGQGGEAGYKVRDITSTYGDDLDTLNLTYRVDYEKNQHFRRFLDITTGLSLRSPFDEVNLKLYRVEITEDENIFDIILHKEYKIR
jgi:hypothetical protein